MGTGTSAHGEKGKRKSHIMCRRCGKHSYHVRKKKCSSCGFGNAKRLRYYRWKKPGK